ncbi:hypothetical protein B0H12DRAFT_106951 [Mycena haematopus]|nr:hypothetical protein B0H12DRAFT_106951 [Mycena haematopus]
MEGINWASARQPNLSTRVSASWMCRTFSSSTSSKPRDHGHRASKCASGVAMRSSFRIRARPVSSTLRCVGAPFCLRHKTSHIVKTSHPHCSFSFDPRGSRGVRATRRPATSTPAGPPAHRHGRPHRLLPSVFPLSLHPASMAILSFFFLSRSTS